MFDKEFEEKLKESMDTPRDLDFDEGAWASLDQQLEIIGAASGATSFLGAGLKAAFWGTKSWVSIAATVILMGTTAFFFYQWQQTEREMSRLEDEQMSRLEDEQIGELENEGMKKLENEQISRLEDEQIRELENEEMRELGNEEISGLADEEGKLIRENKKTANLGVDRKQEEGNDLEEKRDEQIANHEHKDILGIQEIPFLTEARISLHVPEPETKLAEQAVLDMTESNTRRVSNPLRMAIFGSLSSINTDSLQPFNGKSMGLRGEFWLRNDIAVCVGIQQRTAESEFVSEEVDPIRDVFRPLNTPLFRGDSLISANLTKREILLPVGFRYVPFQNHRFKLFTGIGLIFQKATEQEVTLTFYHSEHFPPFPPREYEYTVQREREAGPIKLAYTAFEVGGRLKLTPQTEMELVYTYQQEINQNTSPYNRRRGHNLASGFVFSF